MATTTPGEEVLTTASLFCVPKAGQPGQWRVIANMRDGGQNACIAPDPVYLNRPSHILEQMYHGGYGSLVDASKYFYQYGTHPADRPFHPKFYTTTLVCPWEAATRQPLLAAVACR